MTHSIIEGAYLRDLLEQPEALKRTLALSLPDSLFAIAQRIAGPQPPFVVLTGMGSSFHALHLLSILLAGQGIPHTMIETSELVYYSQGLLGPNTLIVAVSQSGRSAEMVRLVQLNAAQSSVIGITNDAHSPLARAADALVTIHAGPESSVSCKTYVSTLLALSRVGAVLCGQHSDTSLPGLEAVPQVVADYLGHWRDHCGQAQECLQGVRHLILAGRGGSLATTGTGGLILKEAARFPSEGMSAAAFRHGPLEMVNSSLLLLVFRGAERSAALNRNLVREVVELGGSAQLVSNDARLPLFRTAPVDETLGPILEILPVQMISLALAAREGIEAGAFLRATKVTSVE